LPAQAAVWRLLAAILWLGNVDFEGEEDAAVAAPAEALANAAALLGVAEPALATALTERVLSAGARPGPPAQERLGNGARNGCRARARSMTAVAERSSPCQWLASCCPHQRQGGAVAGLIRRPADGPRRAQAARRSGGACGTTRRPTRATRWPRRCTPACSAGWSAA